MCMYVEPYLFWKRTHVRIYFKEPKTKGLEMWGTGSKNQTGGSIKILKILNQN
jgi:hypothetical protein